MWKFWRKPPVSPLQAAINKAKEDAKNQVAAIEAAQRWAWAEQAAPTLNSIPDRMRETENAKRRYLTLTGLPKTEFWTSQSMKLHVKCGTFTEYLIERLEELGLNTTYERDNNLDCIVKVWFT